MQRVDPSLDPAAAINNDLLEALDDHRQAEPAELPSVSLTRRACEASAKFMVNSVFCGSLGGYGFNSILLYTNDPLTYGETVWDITQDDYISPFLLIDRGLEYSAYITTLLLVSQPASLADVKYLFLDNLAVAVEHVAIDLNLLPLAVMLYMQNTEFPDLLELCMLNSLITLARNLIELPVNYIGEKLLTLDALSGLRNYSIFAPSRELPSRRPAPIVPTNLDEQIAALPDMDDMEGEQRIAGRPYH